MEGNIKGSMKKIFGLLTTLLLLNGCAESVALLGTSAGSASNGKMLQSSINSAISYGIKQQTGKGPIQHVIAYAEKIKCKLSSSRVDSKHWELHISTEQEPRTSNRIQLSKYKDRHGANKLEVIWDNMSEREMNKHRC